MRATQSLPLAWGEVTQADGAARPIPRERVLRVGLVHVPQDQVASDSNEDLRTPIQIQRGDGVVPPDKSMRAVRSRAVHWSEAVPPGHRHAATLVGLVRGLEHVEEAPVLAAREDVQAVVRIDHHRKLLVEGVVLRQHRVVVQRAAAMAVHVRRRRETGKRGNAWQGSSRAG
eukprot:CAMPEP_0113263902 /NCGR_PEP_ID=MMETSP0008_2-20120614/18697_1 /TAXON_ID=97485 /ORGANISM="Prymnesium parvum" /LENGTH=171 /DNA_ID=CAMNT_0000112647 /DNA_START=591 /DNA_END=1106 /DNA_ORIENTATION=- /assembly_acc=CAM_ASM_000153